MDIKLSEVINILAKTSLINVEEIDSETDIFQDLELDSLCLIETFVEFERRFGIKINPATILREEIRTPQKIIEFINHKSP